jgi:protein phosphatase
VGLFDWLRNLVRPPAEAAAPIAASPPAGGDEPITAEHPVIPSLALAAGRFELRVGVVSTVGNVREHNEDNFYVPGRPSLQASAAGVGGTGLPPGEVNGPAVDVVSSPEGLPGLFLVADGMGGQMAGEKASEMAVEVIPEQLAKRLGPDDDEKAVKKAVREAVAEANKEILTQSHLFPEFANMGTTVVLALFRGDRAYLAGIGDSRAYRLRDGKLDRLTTDHSLAEALVGAKTIRPEEAENHKFRHVLYLYLGCKDARDGPEEIRTLDLRSGDRFLLASDGLTGVVRDALIAEILGACDDPQRAAQTLTNRALENRSKDNITCVVIQVK